jgi:hypothetical protein
MIGRVYEIVNSDSSIRYVGSTSKTLAQRWKMFNAAFVRRSKGLYTSNISIYAAFDEHGMDAFTINLLYDGTFDDTRALREKEQYFIDLLVCVNKNRAYCTQEYRNQYRKMIAHKYRDLPKMRAKGRVRVLCVACNKEYNYSGIPCHRKTNLHIANCEKNN